MKINKFTSGFVIQTFDTDKNNWVSQEFISDDSSYDYETENGESVDPEVVMGESQEEPYLSYEMRQPRQLESIREQIQEDLMTYLDYLPDDSRTKICQIVVDNFKKLV